MNRMTGSINGNVGSNLSIRAYPDFSDIKDAIMSESNKKTFAAYHALVKSVAEKELIGLEKRAK